jgi:hypothetical protein
MHGVWSEHIFEPEWANGHHAVCYAPRGSEREEPVSIQHNFDAVAYAITDSFKRPQTLAEVLPGD